MNSNYLNTNLETHLFIKTLNLTNRQGLKVSIYRVLLYTTKVVIEVKGLTS